jgi:WD40 repeat protein
MKGRSIMIWNVPNAAKEVARVDRANGCAAFFSDVAVLAVGGTDGIQILDGKTHAVRTTVRIPQKSEPAGAAGTDPLEITSLAFSPNGK